MPSAALQALRQQARALLTQLHPLAVQAPGKLQSTWAEHLDRIEQLVQFLADGSSTPLTLPWGCQCRRSPQGPVGTVRPVSRPSKILPLCRAGPPLAGLAPGESTAAPAPTFSATSAPGLAP